MWSGGTGSFTRSRSTPTTSSRSPVLSTNPRRSTRLSSHRGSWSARSPRGCSTPTRTRSKCPTRTATSRATRCCTMSAGSSAAGAGSRSRRSHCTRTESPMARTRERSWRVKTRRGPTNWLSWSIRSGRFTSPSKPWNWTTQRTPSPGSTNARCLMLGFVVRRKIRSAEKRLGEPLDYMRQMYDYAPDAFWQFSRVAKVASYRSKLPAAPFHIARLVAVKHQDCGPCVQTVVNLAKEDGVEPAVLKAALTGKLEDLPESLRDVYQFADAVAARTGEEETYRERLLKVFGEEAMVELALAIALCQTFPILKRGLGHAKSCSLVKIEV